MHDFLSVRRFHSLAARLALGAVLLLSLGVVVLAASSGSRSEAEPQSLSMLQGSTADGDRPCDQMILALAQSSPGEVVVAAGFPAAVPIPPTRIESASCMGQARDSGEAFVEAVAVVDVSGHAHLILSEHASEDLGDSAEGWQSWLSAHGHAGAHATTYGYSTVEDSREYPPTAALWDELARFARGLDQIQR
jgi:hypothetical protein